MTTLFAVPSHLGPVLQLVAGLAAGAVFAALWLMSLWDSARSFVAGRAGRAGLHGLARLAGSALFCLALVRVGPLALLAGAGGFLFVSRLVLLRMQLR